MAKVRIRTRLWDINKGEWMSVHEVTIDVTEEQAIAIRDAIHYSTHYTADNPRVYKKHIKFSTDMDVLDDKDNCIGGFVHF